MIVDHFPAPGFRSPARPHGVRLCRRDPADPKGKRVLSWVCSVVLAGEKDGVRIWRAVHDGPMTSEHWLVVDHVPDGAVVTGPPGRDPVRGRSA